jgi:magnesium transporter
MINVLSRQNSVWKPIEWEAFTDRSVPCWVDLVFPTAEEISRVGAALSIAIPSRAEMEEIEVSSRLYQEEGAFFMTADLVASPNPRDVESSAITFILAESALITVRYIQPRSFDNFSGRIQKPGSNYTACLEVLIGLLETIVDRMADILEVHSFEIERTSQLIFTEERKGSKPVDLNATIRDIGIEGNHISIIRESLMTLSRMAIFLNQAVTASPKAVEIRDMLRVIGRDIASLADHASFMTNKITFMLDATLGMISIQQNNIIKIFSVAAVVFLPPTLIASIYGMNFQFMPELSHELGYPFAIGLMIISAILPYIYFKRKGWL